jgi:hypothetical protein
VLSPFSSLVSHKAAVEKLLAWESGSMPEEEMQAILDQEEELKYVRKFESNF